jgi:DNA-binding transcriptional regulator YiaG
MLSPAQSRAARAWLEWSQEDLAKLANLSLSTVRDFEKGRRAPISNNLEAIRRALESKGVSFEMDANGNATGISVRNAPVE